MPSPPPPLKRRRLGPSPALSKPFKSPLKNPPAATPPTPTPTHSPPPPTPTSPPPTKAISSTPPPTNSTSPPPTLLSLRRQHASLLATLASERATLDIATQAHKLEASNTDTELMALVKKWRGASREAAEEVYRDVRERVNRMGGVRGWRAREKERRKGMLEFQREWDGEGRGGDGEGGGDGDGEDGEGCSGEERGGEEVKVEKEEEEDEDEDEGFTMDMMLKSLNIDLEIVGFDKEGQRWVD